MANKVPRLEISFAAPSDSVGPFIIEELTFNPFIPAQKRGAVDGPVNIWMELLIRNDGKESAFVPDMLLRFEDNDFEDIDGPTCRLPGVIDDRMSHPIYDDMNFVMHADIWYSFVRCEKNDREFMTSGYNQPVRLLYECAKCVPPGNESALHILTEDWITCRNRIFSDYPKWQTEADDLRAQITQFNRDVVEHENQGEQWEQVEETTGDTKRILYRLKDKRRFAPVAFEKPEPPAAARFGVRRLPWREKGFNALLHRPSWGGTAEIHAVDDGQFSLHPLLFSASSIYTTPAKLNAGDAIRFWVRWQSTSVLNLDKERDRYEFSHIVNVRPMLYEFNTFFRVPEGFDCAPGSPIELTHYPVPLRLFFLWSDRHVKPDQCFSGHKVLERQMDAQFEVFAEFFDKNGETKRLLDLYMLGVIINGLIGLWLAGLYHPFNHETWLGKLHLKGALLAAVLFPLLAAVVTYRRQPFRWISLLALIPLVVAIVYLWHVGPFWWITTALIAAGFLIHTFPRLGAWGRSTYHSRIRKMLRRRQYMRGKL